jgi:hypothetical protein
MVVVALYFNVKAMFICRKQILVRVLDLLLKQVSKQEDDTPSINEHVIHSISSLLQFPPLLRMMQLDPNLSGPMENVSQHIEAVVANGPLEKIGKDLGTQVKLAFLAKQIS